MGSAGLMRMALRRVLHHVGHRSAFGKRLIEQPLMRNVIADLVLESEAATALAVRVAGAVDRAADDPHAAALARVATAIGKFWVCKRASTVAAEAQECFGGIGYIEESQMPRLFRQSPLNAIWEGCSNIQCLDVLRALSREPETLHALRTELEQAKGMDAHFDAAFETGMAMLAKPVDPVDARRFVERLALLLQGATLLRANNPLATHWCVSRLAAAHSASFGTLASKVGMDAALARCSI